MGKRNGRNSKSPAFQVYPGDFIHNVDTAGMTAEEIGVYWLLICYSWDAPLPDDPAKLARMARLTPKKFARAWASVGRCFTRDENQDWVNPRVERERIFQKSNHERMQNLSQKAAQARQNATSRSPYGAPYGHPPIPYTLYPTPNDLHVRSAHPAPDEPVQPPVDPPAEAPTKKGKPKPDPEKIPNYREAIDLWCRLYESVCGRPYGFDGGKDGKHMKAILTFAKSDLSVIRERTLMLLHAAPEWIDKGGKDLGTLRSAWNKLSSMGTGQTSGSKQIALQGLLGPLEGKPPEITHPAPSGLLDLPRTKGNR